MIRQDPAPATPKPTPTANKRFLAAVFGITAVPGEGRMRETRNPVVKAVGSLYKYHFFLFTSGTGSPQAPSEVPIVPSWL